jgi:hypothetical protein
VHSNAGLQLLSHTHDREDRVLVTTRRPACGTSATLKRSSRCPLDLTSLSNQETATGGTLAPESIMITWEDLLSHFSLSN